MKILVIDDDIIYRTLLEHALEELEDLHGIEILMACDGVEGLDMVRKHRPQLVFLDIVMPEMSGYDVCRAIKEDGACANTDVVLLTAKGENVDRKLGMQCGAREYVNKPFDPDDLLSLAKKILNLE